jgi:hypothetical protein
MPFAGVGATTLPESTVMAGLNSRPIHLAPQVEVAVRQRGQGALLEAGPDFVKRGA